MKCPAHDIDGLKMTAQNRFLQLHGAHNVRDLGGCPLLSGGATRWRSVLRGDSLLHLVPEAQARLVELGLRTVIDLRTSRELERNPNPFAGHPQIAYHNISLFSALAPVQVLIADGKPYDLPARYRQAVDFCQKQIAEVITSVAEAREGAVLFHCSVGKDRTGVIAAILLSYVGVAPETVIGDYALSASAEALLMKYREKSLAQGVAPDLTEASLACEPQTMRDMLLHIEAEHGGAANYLAKIGLRDGVLSKLRARLVAAQPPPQNA